MLRRIVRIANEVSSFVTRFFLALWKLVTGGGSTELDEVLKGIQKSFTELNFETVGQQIGSGLSALVAVNVVGTLFLISPGLVGAFCFICGVVWPTWIGGAYRRILERFSDIAAKGRREMALQSFASEGRYHYFLQEDGTKRWYRTGKPVLDSLVSEKKRTPGKAEMNKKKSRFSWPSFFGQDNGRRRSK